MLGGRMKRVTVGQGDEFQDTAALLQGLREGWRRSEEGSEWVWVGMGPRALGRSEQEGDPVRSVLGEDPFGCLEE